jgi:hypothetical protein
MTGATRPRVDGVAIESKFEPLDDKEPVGFLDVRTEAIPWLAVIDGGTRLLGIERALTSGVIGGETTFDLRLFSGMTIAEEVALFLLINEKQKRVRTDLGVRVVQRYLDDGKLSDQETRTLSTVVPDADQWKYDAVRIAGKLNADIASPWQGLIQMPGDTSTKPIKLQAFWTSLKDILDDDDIKERLRFLESQGMLQGTATDFLLTVLKNFWGAVVDINPDAREEPHTNVLWGSIGVSACHQALSGIVKTIIDTESPNLTRVRFREMLKDSNVADYAFWFSRPGTCDKGSYPGTKGEATTYTGGSGYGRLASLLEKEWRANLHAAGPSRQIAV